MHQWQRKRVWCRGLGQNSLLKCCTLLMGGRGYTCEEGDLVGDGVGDCQAGRGETPLKRSRIEEREKGVGRLPERRSSPSPSHERKYRVFVIPEQAVVRHLAGHPQLVNISTPSRYWHCLGRNVQGSKHTASHCHIHMSMYPLLCSTAALQLLRYLNNKRTRYPPNPIITQGRPPS